MCFQHRQFSQVQKSCFCAQHDVLQILPHPSTHPDKPGGCRARYIHLDLLTAPYDPFADIPLLAFLPQVNQNYRILYTPNSTYDYRQCSDNQILDGMEFSWKSWCAHPWQPCQSVPQTNHQSNTPIHHLQS